jgi:hypothetical protein
MLPRLCLKLAMAKVAGFNKPMWTLVISNPATKSYGKSESQIQVEAR